MRKSKRKHLVFALLALLSIGFYACYDGEDWGGQSGAHRVSPRKRNKQLTTSVARQWYESHYDPVVSVSTRSGGDDEMPALIKPKWAHATERNRGRYEVVQMPILTQTRRMIVDEETRLHFDELRAQKKLRNSTHLVIMKDLKTGHVRSFISVFVGSYDYLKKTKRMSRNTYLYREKDFDGKVLFFKLNGSMINGWKYRDGKIVGKIMPIDEDAKILMTRSSGYWEEQCYTETYYEEVEECEEEAQPYYDEEFGLWGVETVVTCQKVDKPIYTQVCEDVWVEDEEFGGGVEPDVTCPICGKINCSGHNDSIPKPCDRAQELSLDTGLVSRINEIYKKTYPHKAGNTEQGFIYTSKGVIIHPTFTDMGSVKYTNAQVADHEFKEWYHSHPGGGGAIPSLGDLKALSLRYQQGYIKSNDFTYGVVSYYGCLSIMISSSKDFTTFAEKVRNKEFDNEWNRDIDNGKSVSRFEIKIEQVMSFFTKHKAGLSVMFRPMQDEHIDNNFENWIAKDLNENNKLIDKDCK